MASPNLSEIITTTLMNRSSDISDNVTKNNAILAQLKRKGRSKPADGGEKLIEHLSYATNTNGGWYSGYDTLPTAAQDVLTSAEFAWKQYAIPVVISGLEQRQNSGKEKLLDLMEERITVAESTMANDVSQALYSDGTGSGGKQLTGLAAAVPVDPTTGIYGGINRATNAFWRSYVLDTNAAPASATIQGHFNTIYSNLVRGTDRPDLIMVDNTVWSAFMASLQALQRFAKAEVGALGFPALEYMGADVILDGGIDGYIDSATALFLNTKYLRFRPHKDQNFAPLPGGERQAVNQDAAVSILGFMGNLVCSNSRLQGRGIFS